MPFFYHLQALMTTAFVTLSVDILILKYHCSYMCHKNGP